ncbi:protein PIN-LIKES 2-like [Ziziphus jujuba]|uniref:Protein PIN-LIKES 2-like n=1 Tax=Ziziphus jujuba TaxID=326968 RepID=A0ABM4A813_ZIZJJ|nr:protein PIN-LIKES 2-like [Ziziphus jujuba]
MEFNILAVMKQRDIKSEGGDVLNAVLPLLKLLSLAVIGLLIAHPKIQLVPKATLKLLSKLVFALFLPCLIFTNLGPSITLKNLTLWWFIPVNVLLITTIGCILGLLVAIICRPPPQYYRFTVIMTAFENTGNLPLSIVTSVCHSQDNPFGPKRHVSGVAYVAFSQWASAILVYTLVYHMMEPPLEYYEIIEENAQIEIEELSVNDLSGPLLVEAEWPGMEDNETEHCKTPFIARLFNDISGVSNMNNPEFESSDDESPGCNTESIRCLAEPKMVRKIRIVAESTPISHILQPPIIIPLLAIVIRVFPGLKAFVFGADAVLSFITDSLAILADAMVPSAMVVLGGMLAEGPNESNLGVRTTIGIIVARLLVLPLVGIGVVLLADRWNLLVPGDQLYKLVLLLQYTTPSAILLGAIVRLRGYAVREASALLFWQHVFAVFSLSLYIILYFKILLAYI